MFDALNIRVILVVPRTLRVITCAYTADFVSNQATPLLR